MLGWRQAGHDLEPYGITDFAMDGMHPFPKGACATVVWNSRCDVPQKLRFPSACLISSPLPVRTADDWIASSHFLDVMGSPQDPDQAQKARIHTWVCCFVIPSKTKDVLPCCEHSLVTTLSSY